MGLEKKIDDRTRASSKLIDQLQTAKFGVERVTSDLEQLKVSNQQKREEHANKLLKLEEAKNQTEATKNQLKEVEGEQLSAEQKAATAERILDHEEMIVKNLMDQAKKAREMLFKRQQELKKVSDE